MLHPSTFEYHQPSKEHIEKMAEARAAARRYADALELLLPDGPDKTYVMRQLRTVAMWANVCIDRLPDGTPRE